VSGFKQEGLVVLATVRGVPNVTCLRRRCYHLGNGEYHYDWAHTTTSGYTCTNDDEVIVTAIVNTDMAYGLTTEMIEEQTR
jgi:hypothetical protein